MYGYVRCCLGGCISSHRFVLIRMFIYNRAIIFLLGPFDSDFSYFSCTYGSVWVWRRRKNPIQPVHTVFVLLPVRACAPWNRDIWNRNSLPLRLKNKKLSASTSCKCIIWKKLFHKWLFRATLTNPYTPYSIGHILIAQCNIFKRNGRNGRAKLNRENRPGPII